ncbi:DENN domain-containing protein [Lyophyllum atratum]|nr:DENN domain-containing protein [Lyophyllum atratum]
MAVARRPAAVPPTAVAASPIIPDRVLKSRFSDQSLVDGHKPRSTFNPRSVSNTSSRATSSGTPIINISLENNHTHTATITNPPAVDEALADELDYITVTAPPNTSPDNSLSASQRTDKASRILGIKHRRSMEPIPASARNSIVSTRSVRDPPPMASFVPTLPLTSLYVVSGLPKSPHTWTLADPDSVLGLHHSDGAVSRWWRPEVLGSTVSPGAGGGKKKKRGKGEEVMKGAGALSKQEVGKMLSKALKLSFTREVEVIASTLQPASTIHTFTFTLPAPNTPLAPTPSGDLLRASVLSSTDNRSSAATFAYPYTDDPFARPSSAYLGPPSLLGHGSHSNSAAVANANANDISPSAGSTIAYYGVCLTVWSHADAERSSAIRRTLEAGRSRKESAQSIVASRLKNLRADVSGSGGDGPDPTLQARRSAKKNARGPWADGETDGGDTEAEGAMSESDFEVASTIGHGPGESTLFLPGDTVFWLPYALTLVSRHPVYDLMRDYLTLSWARFSKDVQSHTLQISKILAHPAPRAGDLIKLDASPKSDGGDSNLEVIARFPGGLDFGRGLVDINFTMWPLFKCLNIDNILTICEIALAPTGRILFFSRHPAMLGIAVSTIKYLVELRGWNGISLPAVHSRDAKIYIDDPGPWIMGLATEARYSIRPAPEICVCDLSCPSPPAGVVSAKQQREKYRQRLLAAFESHYHPDHSVPRPVCKIQAKRGASSAAVAEQIKPPEWWHSTRIIQAFDAVLQDRYKKPSLLKRISLFGAVKRPPQLTAAEQLIQLSIRKRATAFVDARDDLETKIGRLSRRLNFLMTESDLWRDKFVTFEQYAEKLSAEANQLRTKINKEQRETKRLSGLVTLTAVEKSKLQNQLKDTEYAHKEAVLELEQMRETMEKMEQERAEMVAEVEAQIERALASMAVDIDESDYASSRPSSRLSSASGPSRSRRPSDATTKTRQLRSFGTESTLAESYGDIDSEDSRASRSERETGTIPEAEEETPMTPSKKKRFSASEVDMPQDGMNAVDEGISQKSDNIAQKVFDIEQKLESALAADRLKSKRGHALPSESEEEPSEAPPVRPRASKTVRPKPLGKTGTSAHTDEGTVIYPRNLLIIPSEQGNETPTRQTFSNSGRDEQSTPEPHTSQQEITTIGSPASMQSPPASASIPALTPASTIADDSDTDFQSAYSTSPRQSYGSFENGEDEDDDLSKGMTLEDALPDQFDQNSAPSFARSHRERVSSTATAINSRDHAAPSPPFSADTTITSLNRSTIKST